MFHTCSERSEEEAATDNFMWTEHGHEDPWSTFRHRNTSTRNMRSGCVLVKYKQIVKRRLNFLSSIWNLKGSVSVRHLLDCRLWHHTHAKGEMLPHPGRRWSDKMVISPVKVEQAAESTSSKTYSTYLHVGICLLIEQFSNMGNMSR